LSKRINDILTATGENKIDLIGHSQGGVTAQAYIARTPGTVRKCVLIGSPLYGTKLASLGESPKGAEMKIGSDYLQKITSGPSDCSPDDMLAIWSTTDEFILPAGNACLRNGGRNEKIENCGHLQLVYSKRVYNVIAEFLRSE